MFEFRLRVLDVGGGSFIGIIEGFPEVLVHATSLGQAETDLTCALVEHLRGMERHESTWLDWEDAPTVRITRLYLGGLDWHKGRSPDLRNLSSRS